MKKTGITLLALLLCLGGMTPMVVAEEIEAVPEDVTVEEVQDEVIDETEKDVQEKSSEEASAEEETMSSTDYEVLPTEHGTVSVSDYTNTVRTWWKISCKPDDGFVVASIKVLDETGNEYHLWLDEDEENTYYALKGVFATIEVVFEGHPFPLYLNPDETHHVTFTIDGKPVTEARTGQRVLVDIELDPNEYVSYIAFRDHNNTPYMPLLISESENREVYLFMMIEDEARLDLEFRPVYVDENGDVHKIVAKEINSSRNLTLTNGWYVVNGDVTIDQRVEINGDVNIILPDDKTFSCKDGIHNSEGNLLTIWGSEKRNRLS